MEEIVVANSHIEQTARLNSLSIVIVIFLPGRRNLKIDHPNSFAGQEVRAAPNGLGARYVRLRTCTRLGAESKVRKANQ